MLLDFILPFALILPGYTLLPLLPIKDISIPQKVVIAYCLSLMVMFPLLYVGAITFTFNAMSFIVFLYTMASIVFILVSFILDYRGERTYFIRLINNLTRKHILGLIGSLGLISVYMIVLILRPILDSDVAQSYLPIAREIARSDGFTYSNGFDYNILLKPIAVSVLYAWSFEISGSIITESFRLFPIVPLIVMLVGVYIIAKEASENEDISILSLLIFIVFPLQDRLLFYNAFYPDMLYYPLMFATLWSIIRYMKTRNGLLLCFVGGTLGVASLLKAQTIYITIIVIAIIVFTELRSTKLNLGVGFLLPFSLLIPNFLIETIRRQGLTFSIAGLSIETLPLFVFIGSICCLALFLWNRYNSSSEDMKNHGWSLFIKRLFILLVPMLLISALWYITNLLRFGSLLNTSAIELPNYNWASEVLNSIAIPPTEVDISLYFIFFGFMFIDPSVMGYIWLIVLLVGCVSIIKSRPKGFTSLAMISLLIAGIIFSQVVYTLPYAGETSYNPRDILLLAPLLSVVCASGILFATNRIGNSSEDQRSIKLSSIILVSFYGFMSYIHSVVIWFVSAVSPDSIMLEAFNRTISLFGLSLRETSFQLGVSERVSFAANHALSIIGLSLVLGLPIIMFLFVKYTGSFDSSIIRIRGFGSAIYRFDCFSNRSRILIKGVLASLLILSAILLPRGLVFLQGGVVGVSSDSLEVTYGGLIDFINDENNPLSGDILTYNAPLGLPYYLLDNRLIDLRWTANLAYLKDTFSMNSTHEAVSSLKSIGIKYMLFNTLILEGIDTVLNSTLSNIMNDTTLSVIVKRHGSWTLYALGPFTVERALIPLDGWNVHPTLTNSSHSFVSNGSGLFCEMYPSDINSRLIIVTEDGPNLNLGEYNFVSVRLLGDSNALLLIRFFTDDNSGFDIIYWQDLIYLDDFIYPLGEHSNQTLRGSIYIGLKSSDALPTSVTIIEISFIRVVDAEY